MKDDSLKNTSKFLSYVLRHHPEAIGLQLDEYGWAHIPTLIRQAQKEGRDLNREKLLELLRSATKKRFILSEDENYIRAGYGHSFPVELTSEPQQPPEILYHGTARKNLESIEKQGIHSAGRNYVHLSATPEDARAVGRRHGQPAVLPVAAGKMHEEGFSFYRSESEEDIWLVKEVPPPFIQGNNSQ